MSLMLSSNLGILPTRSGKTRVNFIVGETSPDELAFSSSDREGISCSVLVDPPSNALLLEIEAMAVERALDVLRDRHEAAQAARMKHSDRTSERADAG